MEEVLVSVIGNLNGSIEHNHAVITHDPLPVIMGDKTHLEQLLQNLIANALKYRARILPGCTLRRGNWGPTGCFRWPTTVRASTPSIRCKFFSSSNGSTATSTPARDRLATCKRLVERYGGRIWVESEAGKGRPSSSPCPPARASRRLLLSSRFVNRGAGSQPAAASQAARAPLTK